MFVQERSLGGNPRNPLSQSPGSLSDFSQGQDSYRGMGPTSLVYQVHVLGEVERPGTYRISPSMRVTDALELAGGVKKSGSERLIQLRRPEQSQGNVIDLFSYKVLGQLSQNPYLQDNQTVFVPLMTKAVEIQGPVRRPGTYELKKESSLQEVIQLAGGFSVGDSDLQAVKVIRYESSGNKTIAEVKQTTEELRAFSVRDGDVIVVPHKFFTNNQFDYNLKKLPNDNVSFPSQEDKVFVIGAVRAPGAFPFNQYYNVRQYLTLAGGTTIMAKRGKIKVITPQGKSTKAKQGEYAGVVNPGDTIVVPEKTLNSAYYISLFTTLASMGLSAVAVFSALRDK